MARLVRLDTLRSRIRFTADMPAADEFVLDADINSLINWKIGRFWDLLIDIGPPDWITPTDTTITTTPGTTRYALPSDFRSVVQVYALEAADYFRPLAMISDVDRVRYRSPQGAYSVTVRYIPTPPVLSADGDMIDDMSGWSELIVYDVARELLDKEESDSSRCVQRLQEVEQRIRNQAGMRNIGLPIHVTDVDGISEWPFPFRQALEAYQVVGTNLDLFTLHPVFP